MSNMFHLRELYNKYKRERERERVRNVFPRQQL